MQTILEIQKVIAEKERDFGANPEFVKLRQFYQDMRQQGLATKREYSLPPLDTIGQGLFRAEQEAIRSEQS